MIPSKIFERTSELQRTVHVDSSWFGGEKHELLRAACSYRWHFSWSSLGSVKRRGFAPPLRDDAAISIQCLRSEL